MGLVVGYSSDEREKYLCRKKSRNKGALVRPGTKGTFGMFMWSGSSLSSFNGLQKLGFYSEAEGATEGFRERHNRNTIPGRLV